MHRRRLLAVLWAVVLSLALAACGAASQTTTTATAPLKLPPPSGSVQVCSGLTDTCQTVAAQTLERRRLAPQAPGCRVVDVADYQGGALDWARIKPYICGAVDKAGEGGGYGGGGWFARNWSQQRALGIFHAAYWFVRPAFVASCLTQANLFIARLKSVGYATDHNSGPPELDMEVSGANLSACLTYYLQRAFPGRAVNDYTAPGTWPGGPHGANALWQAEYGPVLHSFWSPVVLWQCTDGINGCVTYTPGIGYGDVSVNRGFTSQVLPTPPPPNPVIMSLLAAPEIPVVKSYYDHRCTITARPSVCVRDRTAAMALAHNVYVVANATRPPTYGTRNRGYRLQVLMHLYRR